MRKLIFYSFISSLSFLILSSCVTIHSKNGNSNSSVFPTADREFRAAWIATVANINWPSKPGLSTEEQKKEALNLLDVLHSNNFNAVIFQVRPQCDALYKSDIEPWSYFLTGQQGKPPNPLYDPLEFWIEEAHKRGLELHAWINPYRAHHIQGDEITNKSVVKKHPNLVLELKSGYWWLDPSNTEAQDYSFSVTMDIVKRYDIDGIHIDDYFYPYPSYYEDEDFPDEDSWNRYLNSGEQLSRGDWRRDNVNKFVKRIYKGINEEKPFVKFGISPFGIWRPNHPKSIEGMDQYEKLYADAKLWLNEGWMDYWTPQLYWSINDLDQSYPILVGWWKNQNLKDRHFWPGIKINKGSNELINEIMVTRGMLPKSPGNVHYNVGDIVKDTNLAISLLNGPYRKQALVPTSPWLDNSPPQAPNVKISEKEDTLKINLSHNNLADVFKWVIYFYYGESWRYIILESEKRTQSFPIYVSQHDSKEFIEKFQLDMEKDNHKVLSKMKVSAVDRLGNESNLTDVPLRNILD